MSPVCKMADNRQLTVGQKLKVVLFYAATKSVCSSVTNATVRLQEVVRQNGGHIEHVLH
jgi:hypothetical protein